MTKRPRPDMNLVRDAMRDRDERAEEPDEPPPPEQAAEARDREDDGAA